MSRKSKLRRNITLWHKRIGLISAIFVFILSATGFLLNHTSDFSLDSRYITSSWLLKLYSVESPELRSYKLGDDWVSQAGESLFFNGEYLSDCGGQLVGAVSLKNYWVAVCKESSVLFSFENSVIETVDDAFGLPVPIARAGLCGTYVCVRSGGGDIRLNFESLEWEGVTDQKVLWSRPGQLPGDMEAAVELMSKSKVISVEKVVLDLHAGRFFGWASQFLVDVMALCFCLFAGSGVYVWASKRQKKSL